jgi:hypothetical protein
VTDMFSRTIHGRRALVVVPTIAEWLPPEVREGLARRRLLALGRPCPCGARPPRLTRAQRREIERRRRKGKPGGVYRVAIEHEAGCPATGENIEAAATRHGLILGRWST